MNDTEPGRPLTEIERKTLETLLSVDFTGVSELRAQIPMARSADSTSRSAPTLDIVVPKDAPRSIPRNMAPIRAFAFDSSQEYTGEFILWLADGHLSQLEYAWVTDETPKTLPDPSRIQVSVEE